MKLLPRKKCFAAVFAAILFTTLATSCKKDKEEDPTMRTSVAFSGDNEVPAVSTTGMGTIDITYSPLTKIIDYKVHWMLGSSTATVTGMHFHGAADGTDLKSSAIVIPVTGFSTASTGDFSGTSRVITQEEEDQFLAGKWYFNIHSTTKASGELRANIKF